MKVSKKFNFNCYHKKAISSVTVVALLLIVTIISIVGFQNWFSGYFLKVFSDVEVKGDTVSTATGVNKLIGNNLYFMNNDDSNITVNKIKIGKNLCTLNNNQLKPGMNEIEIRSCLINLNPVEDVVIVVDGKIYTKTIFIKNRFFPLALINNWTKINALSVNFTGEIENYDNLGGAVAYLGKLDGIHRTIAVGAEKDDDGGDDMGAVYIIYLNYNGSVHSYEKISDLRGGFQNQIGQNGSRFGDSIGLVSDKKIVVGAPLNDVNAENDGSIFILNLYNNGSVKNHTKIASSELGLFSSQSQFGSSVEGIGDLDNDGVSDIAVGIRDQNGPGKGKIVILFLNKNDTVKGYSVITDSEANFGYPLDSGDFFGSSIALIDGNKIAVGAKYDEGLFPKTGAVYILNLYENGTVQSTAKINDSSPSFVGELAQEDYFGSSVEQVGDLDGNGVTDIVVGAPYNDETYIQEGAFYILFMNNDDSVKKNQKISSTSGSFSSFTSGYHAFGADIANIGDLNGDGISDLSIGAWYEAGGGAVYNLFMK